MPNFFFTVRKDGYSPETVDVECHDLGQAREEAIRMMGQEIKDHPGELWNDQEWHVEVKNDQGLVLASIYSAAMGSAASPR